MKAIARSLVVILMALIAVPALAVSVTLTTAVQLLATTALIMGGTQHPLSSPTDPTDFVTGLHGPGGSTITSIPMDHRASEPDASTTGYAVIYPAEFFPVFGYDDVR